MSKIIERYVITLTGDSKKCIDLASIEIKQLIEEKNMSVCTISKLNGLIDNMESCQCHVIINKCYGMNENELTHLARFIRKPIWHPWMFYIKEKSIIKYEENLAVNYIYVLNAKKDIKINDMNLFFN